MFSKKILELLDPLQGMADNHDQIVSDIQAQVATVVELVTRHHPVTLLMSCHLHFLATLDGKLKESEMGREEMVALRLPEYVQSIIVSNPQVGLEMISPQNFSMLVEAVSSLYELLMLPHLLAEEGQRHQKQNRGRNDFDTAIMHHTMGWLAVRGDRHIQQDFSFLREFLGNHSQRIERKFHLTAGEIVVGLEKLYDVYTDGINRLMDERDVLTREWKGRVAEVAAASGSSLPLGESLGEPISPELNARLQEIFDQEGFQSRFRALDRRYVDGSLHDILTITGWPEGFVDALAFSPGEDTEFMAGDRGGWPIHLLPTMKRPFLKWDGRYYFFEATTLFDYIYHNIKEVVTAGDAGGLRDWNDQQGDDTEKATHATLSDLLPGAEQLEVYYYDFLAPDGTTQFAEGDGLMLHARHLILVEVKSGRTSHRAPSGAVKTYLNAVGRLIADPVAQAERFLTELRRVGSVVLRDQHRKLLMTLSVGDFDQMYVITTTLEHLGEFTANVAGSTAMRVAQKNLPVFSVQLNDLGVIRDLTEFPAQFFHFLDQRMKAQALPKFATTDEMEHFALYLRYNQYTTLQDDFPEELDFLSFFGMKADIDTYYHRLWREETPNPKPVQELPGRYGELLRTLSRTGDPTDVRAAKYLLDLDGPARTQLAESIEQMLASQRLDQRLKPLHTGGERSVSVFGFTVGLPRERWTAETCYQYAVAVMKVRREAERLMLRVFFGEQDQVTTVTPRFIGADDIRSAPAATLAPFVEGFQRMLVSREEMKRKIRPNEMCPCNSGKKYKRCHGKGR